MAQMVGETIGELAQIDSPELDPQRNQLPPAAPRDITAEQALYGVLADTLGYASHRTVEINGRPPRAEVTGYSIARGKGDDDTHTAVTINPMTGTLAIAEGIGNPVAAQAVTQGFVRAMKVERTAEAHIGRAVGKVEDALHRTVPKILKATLAQLGAKANAAEAIGLGVQIVDNKLVYSGGQPLLVYNLETGECKRLTYNKPTERGVYPLSPGRHVVVMCGGIGLAEDMPSATTIGEAIHEAILEPWDTEPGKPPLTPTAQVSRHLQAVLGGAGNGITVASSMVEVADYWEDTRPGWRQAVDWIRPATFAYTSIARATIHRGEERRRIYEQMTQGGRMSRLGARALATGDAVANVTVAAFLARTIPGVDQLFGHQIEHLVQSVPGLEPVLTTHAAQPDIHHVADTQPIVNQPAIVTNTDVAPALPAQQITDAPDTYTALVHDPNNGGRPTMIYDIARQRLAFYGHQAGLNDAQIATLTHDPTALERSVEAFKGDGSNGVHISTSADWVDANQTYSAKAINTLDKQIAFDTAHRLGIEAPAPAAAATPAPAPKTPVTTTPPIVAAQPATRQNTAVTNMIVGSAETALVAGIDASVVVGSAAGIRSFLRRLSMKPVHRTPKPPRPTEPVPAARRRRLPSLSNLRATLARAAEPVPVTQAPVQVARADTVVMSHVVDIPEPVPPPVSKVNPRVVDNVFPPDAFAKFQSAWAEVDTGEVDKLKDSRRKRQGIRRMDRKNLGGKVVVDKAWRQAHAPDTNQPNLLARLRNLIPRALRRRQAASAPTGATLESLENYRPSSTTTDDTLDDLPEAA